MYLGSLGLSTLEKWRTLHSKDAGCLGNDIKETITQKNDVMCWFFGTANRKRLNHSAENRGAKEGGTVSAGGAGAMPSGRKGSGRVCAGESPACRQPPGSATCPPGVSAQHVTTLRKCQYKLWISLDGPRCDADSMPLWSASVSLRGQRTLRRYSANKTDSVAQRGSHLRWIAESLRQSGWRASHVSHAVFRSWMSWSSFSKAEEIKWDKHLDEVTTFRGRLEWWAARVGEGSVEVADELQRMDS